MLHAIAVSNTGWPNHIGTDVLYALTLPNINRFSKLFLCQNQENICTNAITKDSTTPQVCRHWGGGGKLSQRFIGQWRRRLEAINTLLFPVINFLKCVVTQVVLFSVVAFKTLDISQGSVAT